MRALKQSLTWLQQVSELQDSSRARLVSVSVSGVFTGLSLLLHWQNLLAPYGTIAAALVAILASGWLILPKAIRHTSLWMAILADTGATLVVIANALRLLKTK